MKALKFEMILSVVILSFVLLSHTGYAQDEKYNKTFHKEYKADVKTVLDIENKFGDITVKDWDQNTVTLDVVITIEDDDREDAEEKLSFIHVDFSENDTLIKALTRFDEKFSKSKMSFSFGDSEDNFSIDYTVYVPRYLRMNLFNKYGSIFINEIHGKSNITVKYGTLKANKLLFDDSKPLSTVNIAYSKGYITQCNWAKCFVSYSELEIDESKALILVSKYSKVKLDKNNSLVSECKYDVYSIQEMNNLVSTGKYTTYKIGTINKKLDMETKYGAIKVASVLSSFESIRVDADYTDVKIGIDPAASYYIKGYGKYSEIRYDEKANIDRNVSGSIENIEGWIGNNKSSSSKVTINVEYSDVDLRKKQSLDK